MELNLSELDNLKTMNPYDTFNYNSYEQQSEKNYWETQKTEIQPKKKKVSFNDILSNMNLVVNREGILQFMVPNNQQEEKNIYQDSPSYEYQSNFSQTSQYNSQNNSHYNKNNQQNPVFQQSHKKINNEPLDSSVKHSYIYNKYFSDYVDPNVQKQGPRVPKTMEEYYQMLLDDKKNAVEHKLRMEQIKSKKLLFTTNPNQNMNLNPQNIQASKNNLRMMSFR